jgi:hypothetical protein
MKECLSEERLVAVYYGDATEGDREHRESCLACTRRYQALTSDLDHISAALAEVSTDFDVNQSRPVTGWVITAVAAALVAALVWNVSSTPPPTAVAAAGARVQVAEQTEEVSEAVFDAADPDALRVTVRDRDEDYVRAALDGGFPCLWYDPLYADDCDYTVEVGYVGG